ncbi:MAG: hypothetical protein KGJ57_06745 [Sphingomonadales bacterium]|nr:hypothetical protein [Sphingomonadales bacterium]MDE2169113.1 hypothetical protein [Sphingomonadales bacterium]
MSKVLIDVALMIITLVACCSLIGSARQFMTLFVQLRAEMAAGMTTQEMRFTIRLTSASTTLAPVTAMAYQPGANVAHNTAGALAVTSRPRRRPAVIRAAA